MAHIHFAWELGGGLGHAGRLKPLALEALRRGHRVSLSLRDATQIGNKFVAADEPSTPRTTRVYFYIYMLNLYFINRK